MDIQAAEKCLESFFDAFAAIQYYQRLADKTTKQIVKDLFERYQKIETLDAETKDLMESSIDVFFIHCPFSGQLLPYSHKKTTLKEMARLVHLHKNRQYQWLLVESYEIFEDFIVSVYENIRKSNADFRIGADKDGTMLSAELKKKVFPIMSIFRDKIPEVKELERCNKSDKDLRLFINIVDKFRNIIVHKNGKTSDTNEACNQILKRACLLSDQAAEPVSRATIKDYFGSGEYEGLIILVEKPVFQSAGIAMHINRHEALLNALLGYAVILLQSLVLHFAPQQA